MKRILSALMLIGSSATIFAQNNCRQAAQLETYHKILPTEKVYIHSDQSYYEPGNTIWFKAYILDAALQATTTSGQLRVELFDAVGNKAATVLLEVQDGVANGDFMLSNDAVGGIYTLKAFTSWQKNFGEAPVFEKKLTVQRYQLPNLLMTLDFMRERYGAGAEVSAKLSVRSKNNEPLANKKCDYTVELAGKKHASGSITTNQDGLGLVIFKLPEDLSTADGLLNILIEQDGSRESISRSVPIMTRKMSLKLLPEGGDMVDGFRNRVAFKALDEFGKPVDFKGRVVNQNGKEICSLESYHQGLGAFFLAPQKGETYKVEILEPKGISTTYPLPQSLPAAVAMRVDAQNKEMLTVSVHSPKAQNLCLTVQMQDKVQYELGFDASAGENKLEIPTQALPLGIAQITVFDGAEIPQAERLVFVNKHRQLTIDIKTDKTAYQIRDSVWVDVQVTDESGRGVKGDFSMAVVDDKLWTFADDKQDNILSQLLMSSDLQGLVYEPNFYFNPKEAKADSALDYVMLTHGWRRFTWRDLMAKDAEEHWKKMRKFEPEPATAIAGVLSLSGNPLSNTSISIEAINQNDCYTGPKNIKTDAEGKFFIPKFDNNCPVRLTTFFRATPVRHDIYSQYYNTGYIKPDRKQNKGVFLQRQTFRPEAPRPTSSYYVNSPAQGKGSIRGAVRDQSTGEPIMAATIVAVRNGVVVQGTVTDMDGLYQIKDLEPGDYNISIAYIGYRAQLIPVRVDKDKVCILNIDMEEDAVILQEVAVTSTNVQMDRAMASTMVSREVLRTVPGVTSSNSFQRRAITEERAAELPRAQEKRKETLKVIPSMVGEADIIANRGFAKTPVVRSIQTLETVNSSINSVNETNNQNEILRLRGEFASVSGGLSRIQNMVETGDVAVTMPSFAITQAGPPAFYNARVFYAPDYTEYLQAQRRGRAGTLTRSDFRNTIYWQPYLHTDSTGSARVLFFNSDAISTFRVLVEGFGNKSLGRAEHTYSVQMPFELSVKMPRILTFGDTLYLPVVVKNNRKEPIIANLSINAGEGLLLLKDSVPSAYEIPANSILRLEIPYLVLPGQKKQRLVLKMEGLGMSDAINLDYEARSKGFPMEVTLAGKEKEKVGIFTIDQLVQGSLNANIEVYANVLQDMQSTMENMLREPYGCFEQVSSSNYPNILALHYMKSTNSLDPIVYERANGFLNNGYKKLAGYECAGGGFEWFGRSPAHEALTAFGLMEFKDMDMVYSGVDAAMVQRAKNWLLTRRDGQGGFMSNSGYNHGWGNSKAVLDAYITYSLAYIGEKNISREVDKMTLEAENSKDLYRLGLAVLTNFHFGRNAKAEALLSTLVALIENVGPNNVSGEHSITYSYGNALRTEILGIAITALLKSEKVDEMRLRSYVESLVKTRSNGYFGCTQATVWALKAITDFAIYNRRSTKAEGNLVLIINGNKAFSVAVSNKMSDNIKLDLTSFLKEGENEVEVKFEGMGEGIPYGMRAQWATYTPQSSKDCPLSINTSLANATTRVGETVRLTTEISNNTSKDAPSAMALVGIPAGLSLQPWQLKEMLEQNKADFYEIMDNYLVLYYRNIKAGETLKVELDLKAETPGAYRGAASRTYMYYTAEHKDWEEGLKVQVVN